MAVNIGPKIGIDGEKEYRDAINNIIQQAKTLDSEMKLVASSFDKDTSAKEKNAEIAKTLSKQIETQRERVQKLAEMYEKSAKELGENDTTTLKWKEALFGAQTQLNGMEKQLDATKNGVKEEGEAAEKSAERHQKLVSGLKAAGTALAAVAAAAGAAAVKLAKEVISSFGELEQNLGGSEAVFGEYAKGIQKTAEDAYKAMGTSQSEYLATANKIGALFQGSGIEQERSVELTTKAMQRAADMASVMGIETSAALEAITGAAKGNYTMMDNLGVAMNATTLEAYALDKGIETAYKDMSNTQKAELAMKYFFERTEQYAGNFERESTQTITGSLGLLSAAWESFIAGLGNKNADIGNLAKNVTDAFNAVVKNVTPIIENIAKALPMALNTGIAAIMELMPTLLTTATELFQSVLNSLIDALPMLIPVATSMVLTLVEGLIQNLPALIQGAFQLVLSLAQGIAENIDELIPATVSAVLQVVETLLDNIDMLIDAGIELIIGIADGLIEALPILLERALEINVKLVGAIIDNVPKLLQSGIELIVGLANGIIQAIPRLTAKIPEVIRSIKDKFTSTDWASIGKNIMEGIRNGITSMINNLVKTVKNVASNLLDAAKEFLGIASPSKVFANKIGKYIPQGISLGIDKSVPAMLKDAKMQFGKLETTLPNMSRNVSTQNYGGFTINVNAAAGQDANEIADMVMFKIQNAVQRKEAVFV